MFGFPSFGFFAFPALPCSALRGVSRSIGVMALLLLRVIVSVSFVFRS